MENVEFRRYIIGEEKKVTVARAQSRVDEFFMRLPYFQPWVWKLIATLGIIGFFMHVVSTGAFVLVSSLIYKKHKTKKVALIALLCGTIVMTVSMVAWNLIITPYFLGVPREAVMAMMLTVIVPFNLLKAGINSLITLFTYKSIAKFLHK